MKETKQFCISKQVVLEAWQKVKSNKGSHGVDGKSIDDFGADLRNNLYKLWNRMSSGSYFPPPVRTVSIPKKSGGTRKLGIPTVEDRVAQMVAKLYFEPIVDPKFHDDSYGYRPGKSAHDALEVTRQRCWKYKWILEFDIKGMFDNIDHDLLMKAVRSQTDCRWLLLYIERWLKAPVLGEDGNLIFRDKGVPQGGVISPVLSNLFMHFVFDEWMKRNHPKLPICRYADDGLVHLTSMGEAMRLKDELSLRFKRCGLDLHPEKTKIVCCKGGVKASEKVANKFEFLGFEFRSRVQRSRKGKTFVGFGPAISPSSSKDVRRTIKSWKLSRRTSIDLDELASRLNPIIRGWIEYYTKFGKSEFYKVLKYLEMKLVGWVKRKFRRKGNYLKRPISWLGKMANARPSLFAHWKYVRFPAG